MVKYSTNILGGSIVTKKKYPKWVIDAIDRAGQAFENLQIRTIIGDKNSHIISFYSGEAIIRGRIEPNP